MDFKRIGISLLRGGGGGGVTQSGAGKAKGEEQQCRSHHIPFQSFFSVLFNYI